MDDEADQYAPDPLTAEDVCKVVGQRVREFRTGLGLTMESLAERAGLSLGMLSKIEHGQTSPSLATLTSLANAAGVPFTAFFRGLDEEHDAVVVRAGQGVEIAPLAAPLRVALEEAGIGHEVMSTASACRTYNVLLAEDRLVAAVLLAV